MTATPTITQLQVELLEMARPKTAGMLDGVHPAMLAGAAGLGGVALGAVPTWLVKSHIDEQERQRTRNRAFGAGMATGVATPKIVRGLFNIAQRTGFLPEGM